jgi:hypothetical protein
MQAHSLIRIEQVCTHYRVDDAFIKALHELGHIELVVQHDEQYIIRDQLKMLESMIYFYTDLQINIEGIDAIAHLLKQIQDLQDELSVAKNKLRLYNQELR